MSSSTYFDEPDSDNDNNDNSDQKVLTQEDIAEIKSSVDKLKQQGNASFSQNDYKNAIIGYTEAINVLKQNNQPPNALLHLNRSASYLSEKSFVKALHDANIACEIDPDNWKGHWRKGLG